MSTAAAACSGLRVLHAASQIEGINIVLEALGALLPALVNVLWVGLLFYYIFAVSVSALGGEFVLLFAAREFASVLRFWVCGCVCAASRKSTLFCSLLR